MVFCGLHRLLLSQSLFVEQFLADDNIGIDNKMADVVNLIKFILFSFVFKLAYFFVLTRLSGVSGCFLYNIYIVSGVFMGFDELDIFLKMKGFTSADRSDFLYALKFVGYAKALNKNFNSIKEVALFVVQKDGYALECVSENLKNDREVVLAAVKENGNALRHASEELKIDREIVLAAVKRSGTALKYTNEELRDDKEVVLAAVSNSKLGFAFAYVSDRLKNDKEVVFTALFNVVDDDAVKECFCQASAEIKELVGEQDPLTVLHAILEEEKLNTVIQGVGQVRGVSKI